MTVALSGFKSGYKAEVHCRPGSTCYVDCAGNACQQLQLRCYDGADCHVTPDECAPDGIKKRVRGVHCPIWRQIVVSEAQGRRRLSMIADGGTFDADEDRVFGYDDDIDALLEAGDIDAPHEQTSSAMHMCVAQRSSCLFVYCLGYEACE